MSCQNNLNKDSVFVIIDYSKNNNLFKFEKGKNNNQAKIKILHFDKRHKGFLNEKKQQSNKDIILINPEPNNINYYEFICNTSPINIPNIKNLTVFSIEDVSKNRKEVWREYPYVIFFIEKLNCEAYNLWEMTPIFHE